MAPGLVYSSFFRSRCCCCFYWSRKKERKKKYGSRRARARAKSSSRQLTHGTERSGEERSDGLEWNRVEYPWMTCALKFFLLTVRSSAPNSELVSMGRTSTLNTWQPNVRCPAGFGRLLSTCPNRSLACVALCWRLGSTRLDSDRPADAWVR